MMHSRIILMMALLLFIAACNSTGRINNIQDPPEITEADQHYADVFKPLDGTWKGQFLVLEDPNPGSVEGVDLKNLTIEQVKNPAFTIITTIDVQQTYTSESPYFQRVSITDYYSETGKTEVSEGVNKIQDGNIWCVVHKPTESVIHHGSVPKEGVIIWQSKQVAPQRVEYFYETVDEQYYEILGYGYYEGDNLERTPRLWFYGKYKRQN